MNEEHKKTEEEIDSSWDSIQKVMPGGNSNSKGDPKVASRIGFFIIWLLLTIITIGIYPLYYFLTRFDEMHKSIIKDDE